MNTLSLGGRVVGPGRPPLVVAEIGINHEGNVAKAHRMIDDAREAGCECVKFQSHVVDDEMIPNRVVPGNARESIWDIMSRCALSEADERALKEHAESEGMLFLSTPFSRAAAARLERMGVCGYKIGSGECNNYPLVEYIASFGKPVILSTGMNNLGSIAPAVAILRRHAIPFALLHCTSIYPTPHASVRLGALAELAAAFPDAILGLSDHSLGPYTCFAAVALGACILEKHFTSDKRWPGPDVALSLDPAELADLVRGVRAVHEAMGGGKTILEQEAPTIAFAYASVVTIAEIAEGELLSEGNIWVKRPGTGEIRAGEFSRLLGRRARHRIASDTALSWQDLLPDGNGGTP